MTRALQTIRLEHFNIHSVLACLRYLVRAIEQGDWEPDFDLLSTIVAYMDAFPEALHHPKEENYLFAPLLRRRPDAAPLVDRLCEEHAKGGLLLAGLEAALAAYRDDPAAFDRFRRVVASYVEFQRQHMNTEERELLPLLLDALDDADWAEIDAAFAENEDPLFSPARKAEFDALFREIVNNAPAPMGYGDRKAEAG